MQLYIVVSGCDYPLSPAFRPWATSRVTLATTPRRGALWATGRVPSGQVAAAGCPLGHGEEGCLCPGPGERSQRLTTTARSGILPELSDDTDVGFTRIAPTDETILRRSLLDLTEHGSWGILRRLSVTDTDGSPSIQQSIPHPALAASAPRGFFIPCCTRTFPTDVCRVARRAKRRRTVVASTTTIAPPWWASYPGSRHTTFGSVSSSASLILAQDERWRRA